MAKSGNCCGNFISWFFGALIGLIWLPFAALVAFFGGWQTSADIAMSIFEGFLPTEVTKDIWEGDLTGVVYEE